MSYRLPCEIPATAWCLAQNDTEFDILSIMRKNKALKRGFVVVVVVVVFFFLFIYF